MATSRRTSPEPPGAPPTGQELLDALETYQQAERALQDARKAQEAARVVVVDMLRRSGLNGVVL